MCPIPHYTLLQTPDLRLTMRNALVQYAKALGMRAAAQRFGTSRNIVRKCLRRHQHREPLQDQSRRPKRHHVQAKYTHATQRVPHNARCFHMPIRVDSAMARGGGRTASETQSRSAFAAGRSRDP